MKRKTWMISALMYAMVFMACFGVLHVLKTLMEPSGSASVERRESQVACVRIGSFFIAS